MLAAGLLASAAMTTPAVTMPAAPPPAWEAVAVAPRATEVKARAYRVRPGDTLSRIVARTGAGADAIAHANALEPPFRLVPGRLLTIPPGRYHRVGKGESGIAIARAYRVEWSRIAALNHLSEPYILREGERLLLPSASEAARMTLEQRAAAFRIDIDDLVTGSQPALAPRASPAAPTLTARAPVPATMPVAPPAATSPGRFAWPLAGTHRLLRRFGPQPNGGRNDGIDLAAKPGTPIVAAADGVVVYAGPLAGFGQLVLLRHGGSYLSAYGHVAKLTVTHGQAVTRGGTIAVVAATGPEPELHFEIRAGRTPVDPTRLLPTVVGANP